MDIQQKLFALRDEKNAVFVARLIPNLNPETILGARTPDLRKLARELYKTEDVPASWRRFRTAIWRKTASKPS